MFQMRSVKKNQKRLIVLSATLFMICGMALGYAALSSSIKINGTGTISTNWDILFTNIEEKRSNNAVNNDSRITDKLTATFDVDLDSPGSYIEYNVTIKNNGNTDAVITKVSGIVEANNAAPSNIKFAISGIRIGEDLFASSEKTFVIKAEIPRGEVNLPSTSKTLELKVEVRQKEVDSSGLVTTLKECFQTDETGETITGYLCGKNNTNGYSEILDVNIPREINGHTITKIGDYSFDSKKMNSVTIPNSVTMIGNRAFSHNQLSSIHFPSSVKRIGYQSFWDNLLTEIVIPNSVVYIDMAAFSSNKVIGDDAFIYNRNGDGTENKRSLNSYAGNDRGHIVIPDEITSIGRFAFDGLGLQSVVLPSGLNQIEDRAFSNNKLTHVTFQGNVPSTLRNNIFLNNSTLIVNTIQVPIGTLEQYKSAQGNVNNKLQSPSQTWFGSDNESLLNAFYE